VRQPGHDKKNASEAVGKMHHGTEPGDVQSFQRGRRGSTMVRVYDKRKETLNDLVKQQVMIEKRWGWKIPDAATRVEFELPRETLKRWDCQSTEDVLRKIPQMVHWLCKEWFRLTEHVADRKNRNQGRAGLHPLWALVEECFASWLGGELQPAVKLTPEKMRPKVVALLKSAMGCFKSALALEGANLDGVAGELLEECRRKMMGWVKFGMDGNFLGDVEERMFGWGVRLGLPSTA